MFTTLIAHAIILLLLVWAAVAIAKKYWEVFAAIAGGIGAVIAVLAYRRAQKRKPRGRHHANTPVSVNKHDEHVAPIVAAVKADVIEQWERDNDWEPERDTEFVRLTPGTVHFEESPRF